MIYCSIVSILKKYVLADCIHAHAHVHIHMSKSASRTGFVARLQNFFIRKFILSVHLESHTGKLHTIPFSHSI